MKRLVLVSVMMLVMTRASSGSEIHDIQRTLDAEIDALGKLEAGCNLRIAQTTRGAEDSTGARIRAARQEHDDLSQQARRMEEETRAATVVVAELDRHTAFRLRSLGDSILPEIDAMVGAHAEATTMYVRTLRAAREKWEQATELQRQRMLKASDKARRYLLEARTAMEELDIERQVLHQLTDRAPLSDGGAGLQTVADVFVAGTAATRAGIAGLKDRMEEGRRRMLAEYQAQIATLAKVGADEGGRQAPMRRGRELMALNRRVPLKPTAHRTSSRTNEDASPTRNSDSVKQSSSATGPRRRASSAQSDRPSWNSSTRLQPD
jgi:hypothetical protein